MPSTAPILKLSEDELVLILEAIAVLDWAEKRKKWMHVRDSDSNSDKGDDDTDDDDTDDADDGYIPRIRRSRGGPYDPRLDDESYGEDITDRIQAMQAEDQARREDPYSLPRKNTTDRTLGPLLAFSMANKWIRSVAEPLVFRNVFLNLDTHYQTGFLGGQGLQRIPLSLPPSQATAPAIFWPHAVVNARTLSIKLVEYLEIAYVENEPSYNCDQPIPPTIPLGLVCLLDVPRNLRRLRVQVTTDMIDAMRRAAAFRPFPMLPHVEQLIICESCVYLVNLCPNTKMLGCVRFHTDHQGMHDSADFLELIETAACLPKLTSLTVCSAWIEPLVDHIHHHLPNLLELRLNHNNMARPVGLEAMQRMVNKFRRLRTIGIDEIQYIINRLPGTQQRLTYDWIRDCETRYTREARILLAITLLYSGHPALEDIEIRWLCEEKKFKDWQYRCVAEHCQGATGVYRRDTENHPNAEAGVISDRWLSTHGVEMIDTGWHAVGKTW